MSDVFSLAFFFTAADFHLALVTVSISHFLTTATKFSSSLFVVFFLSLALKVSVDPFLFELRWPTACFLFFSVFLLFYIPNL